jgi:hypothetical protein
MCSPPILRMPDYELVFKARVVKVAPECLPDFGARRGKKPLQRPKHLAVGQGQVFQYVPAVRF